MSTITLDHQDVSDTCAHCASPYPVTRGSLYDDGRPVGLYVIGMHGCRAERLVAMAVAVHPDGEGEPTAVHLQVWATPTEFRMTFIDPAESPWHGHHYLGRMLRPAEARSHPQRDRFLHLVNHVLRENPAVARYLDTTAGGA